MDNISKSQILFSYIKQYPIIPLSSLHYTSISDSQSYFFFIHFSFKEKNLWMKKKSGNRERCRNLSLMNFLFLECVGQSLFFSFSFIGQHISRKENSIKTSIVSTPQMIADKRRWRENQSAIMRSWQENKNGYLGNY